MKAIKKTLSCILIFILLFSLASCSNVSSKTDIRVAMGEIPTTFDPQMTYKEEQLMVVRNCFEGLFRATGGKIENAICKSYEISSDGLTYTFNLRNDAKWSDGSDVTAADFEFALLRCLYSETLTPDCEQLFTIKNAEKYYLGKTKQENVGIKATDKYTLVITLNTKDAELIQKLSYSFAMPCKEEFFLSTKGRYCMDRKNSLFNGPFDMYGWDTDSSTVTLSKNEDYVGDYSSLCSYVTISYDTEHSQRIQNVNDSVYDMALIDCADCNSAENADLNSVGVKNKTWNIFFNPNLNNAISDSKISLALKQALQSVNLESGLPTGFELSESIMPDDIVIEQKAFAEYNNQQTSSTYSLQTAKDTFITALQKYSSTFPDAALLYVENDEMKKLATSIVSVWQTHLGAYINVKGVSQSEMYSLMSSGEYQLALCPVYDTDCSASAFINQFHSKSEKNIYSIKDSTLDKYIDSIDYSSPHKTVLRVAAALNSNDRIIPVAQSKVYYAAAKKVTGLNADMYQGHIDLFKLNK